MAADKPPTPEMEPPANKNAETSPASHRTSVAQIEANRKNALRSTGPITPEGKQISRFNAVRHGLRAKHAIIPRQEDAAELEGLIKELCEDWQPEGHTERYFVEQIGLEEWRHRRVLLAEAGYIRRQMASETAREASKVEAEIDEAFESGNLPEILKKSTTGIAYLRTAVEDVSEELECKGEVSKENIDYLKRVFGRESETFKTLVTMLKAWFLGKVREGSESLDSVGEPTAMAHKMAAVRKQLKSTLKDLDRQERKLRRQEKSAQEISRQPLGLLQDSEFARIRRYEIGIKHDMRQAIEQLERLQRRRRGELPPPTVNLKVSNDDD